MTGAKLLSRKHWIVLFLVAGVGVAGFLISVTPRPGVTLHNFDQLRKGMTEAEVASILGSEAV